MNSFVPASSQRVQGHTPIAIRQRNRRQMLERLREYEDAHPAEISERIAQLEREWDIERVLEANAASVALIGLTLGATVNRRWFVLPAVVAGFLLQHAVQGWCPPLPLFRRLGVRTAGEIHREIVALKAMRGDFAKGARTAELAARNSRLH
ncbi:DUF2892 domain-containing protein [Peristeroidobacter agariperforans]|uniref:DUF2892 domain-containing protein n=1 Tax=Peristeroidobacter agariperforans TaxID=268404 RepID=UPI0018E54F50|nr:DUF2892 domain-containing protein [Peristeroidobacter agariperforans]